MGAGRKRGDHPAVAGVRKLPLGVADGKPEEPVHLVGGREGLVAIQASVRGPVLHFLRATIDEVVLRRQRPAETSRTPVSSSTSRTAAVRTCSPSVSLPLGSDQSSYLGRWISAISRPAAGVTAPEHGASGQDGLGRLRRHLLR